MTDDVHPDSGADETAIWNELKAAEAESTADQASTTTTEPNGTGADATSTTTAEPKPADAGGAAAPTEPKKPADAPAAPAADSTTGKPAADPKPDIWANATPEQKAEHEALSTNYRRVSGTVSGLQRRVDELKRTTPAPTPAAPAPAGATGDGKPAGTAAATGTPKSITETEDFQKFAEEFGEVAGPIGAAIRSLETTVTGLKSELGGVSQTHRQQNLDQQFEIAMTAHPDYAAIAGSKEFKTWYEASPPYVRAAVERNADNVVDGNEVAHVVNQFKLETGYTATTSAAPARPAAAAAPTQPTAPSGGGNPKPAATPSDTRRQAQLDSAATPRARGTKVDASTDPDDPEQIWKDFAAKEQRAGGKR